MDKKELKAIILKTLEKEGGAAGIKALAKAAKTSKDKLKKDLNKMELANMIIVFGLLGIIVWGFVSGFSDGTEN